MKIKYVCETCGKMYNEKDECMKCEAYHGKIIGILPKFRGTSKFPYQLIAYSIMCGKMCMSTYEWKKQKQFDISEETHLLEYLKREGYLNEKGI